VDTYSVGDGCHLSKWNNSGQLTIWRRVLLGVARGRRAIGVCLFRLVSGGSRLLSEVQGKMKYRTIRRGIVPETQKAETRILHGFVCTRCSEEDLHEIPFS
jgi:hypothetical protein